MDWIQNIEFFLTIELRLWRSLSSLIDKHNLSFILELAGNEFNIFFSCLKSKCEMVWTISHLIYFKICDLRWDGKQKVQIVHFWFHLKPNLLKVLSTSSWWYWIGAQISNLNFIWELVKNKFKIHLFFLKGDHCITKILIYKGWSVDQTKSPTSGGGGAYISLVVYI